MERADEFLAVACTVLAGKMRLPTYENVGQGDVNADHRMAEHVRDAARTIHNVLAEEMDAIAKK